MEFNFLRSQHKEKKDKLSYRLPWLFMDYFDDILLIVNKDGSLQTTFRFRGPDLDSSTTDELSAYYQKINHIIQRQPTGRVFYIENIRRSAEKYKDIRMPTLFTAAVEQDRFNYFNSEGHYEDDFYFTILDYQPQTLFTSLFSFFNKDDKEEDNKDRKLKERLKDFTNEIKKLLAVFGDFFADVNILNPNEMATYLHSTVSDNPSPIINIPNMYLDSYISDVGLIGGLSPKLGKKHMKVISLLSFPQQSYGGCLRAFKRFDFEYRFSSRFITIGKSEMDKELKQIQRNWNQQSKSLFQMFLEAVRNTQTTEVDQAALNNSAETSVAQQELQADLTGFGYYSMALIILDEDKKKCEEKAIFALKELNNAGFVAKEETFNAVDTWFGSLPGLWMYNIRRYLISSLNFAHLAPTDAVWAGPKINKHLKAPVLLYTDTVGSTPFRLSLHVGDVGHTFVVGPTGSGKSVFLNMIELHFLKYPDAKIFIFDKAASSRALTKAVGGNFYNLLHTDELAFQPLANVDDPNERVWVQNWLIGYLEDQKIQIAAPEKEMIWNTLGSLACMPKKQRNISAFQQLVQDQKIRQALTTLKSGGPYGTLFDANEDKFGTGNWQVFEMESLMNTPAIVAPTLDYLFHKIEKQLTEGGSPAMIILDECWLFFENPTFQGKLREYLRDMRKKNTSIIFATQSLGDIAEQPQLANAVLTNCETQIYLPNGKASNEVISKQYKAFGLNDRQIQIITQMIPKRQYYYNSRLGNRVFDMAVLPLEGAFVTSTSKEDQIAMNKLEEKGIISGEKFIIQWLQHKGQSDVAEKMKYLYSNVDQYKDI
ncbi:conjugal transfer protein TrbE [Dialister micraerophilus]|uniref:VirB4 family type IV secretion/conjugal transfer ATPase n=1 Tax=Dialister micraerophilus TaxID=309120 RepID=UPI0023F04E22|nr:conjugal transfer protein TrbE [Dialister micraerophilus]